MILTFIVLKDISRLVLQNRTSLLACYSRSRTSLLSAANRLSSSPILHFDRRDQQIAHKHHFAIDCGIKLDNILKMSKKNQSIMSFFSTSSQNAAKKSESSAEGNETSKSPIKEATKVASSSTSVTGSKAESLKRKSTTAAASSPEGKDILSIDKENKKKEAHEDDASSSSRPASLLKVKDASKAVSESKSKSKSKKVETVKEEVEEIDESPVKKNESKSKSKRRKVIDSSSDEDVSVTSKEIDDKSPAKPSPKPATKSTKAVVKSEKKVAETAKSPKAAKTPQKETPPPPATAEKKAKSETEAATPTLKKEEAVEVEKKNSPTKATQNLFSKSTSNFFGGKKVDKEAANNSSSSTKSISTSSASTSNDYLPSKEHYHPVNDACWLSGQPVPYKALAQTLYCMERTTKRLELLSMVANYFRSVLALTPKDLVPSLYILTNKVAPDYDSLELGIGDTILFKALAEATGCTVAKLKLEMQSKGDIGLVAEANRCNQKLIFTPKKLTVSAVFTKLKEIASISGNSSQTKKCEMIKGLLVSCDSIEARYLMRSLAGKMRIGLGEQSVLSALGHACAITPPVRSSTAAKPVNNDADESKDTDEEEEKEEEVADDKKQVMDRFVKLRIKDPEAMKKKLEEAVQQVKHAYHQCPNYDRVVSAILEHGIENLPEHCKLTPGVPLKPMLANPTKGLQEILKRFEDMEFTCEYKYDGERAQIHILEDGSVHVFSRNSENNTSKYPDVIESLKEILKLSGGTKRPQLPFEKKKTEEDEAQEAKQEDEQAVKQPDEYPKVVSAILDAEVVAYDTETKVIKPFQVLSTRKRKDVNAAEITIQVCIFAFDLIYLNGESLIDMAFRQRRERMYKYFPHVESKLMFAVNMNSSNLESIQEFLDQSIKDGCEGLMVKTLDTEAHYEISKRSYNWLKLKKDYLDGVGDTLDLVVIGGYMGTGKRTGVYGGYLLACYDDENEEYQTICKLGTGLKDEDLQTQFESLTKLRIDKPKSYYRVSESLEQPDHWFEAEQVWEIKCADFSMSPVHTAAIGVLDEAKGISMRFPRFLRLRDDKNVNQATTHEQVAAMYKNQQQMINQNQQQKGKEATSDNEEEDE